MDNVEIKLFNNDQDTVAMPSIGSDISEEQSSLISKDISDAISGETVKKLILPEESVIAEENFVFDFSDLDSVTIFEREALKSLVNKDGTVSLYLYKKGGMGLVEFGKGEKYSLEREVPLLRHFVFGDGINIYKNYKVGEPAVSIESRDITKMRLNL